LFVTATLRSATASTVAREAYFLEFAEKVCKPVDVPLREVLAVMTSRGVRTRLRAGE
jgi:hypothetical protein